MLNKLICLIIFSLFISHGSAYAQAGGANDALVSGAATGTVIAAAMETVGYQAQSQVLSQMKESLQEVSGLIYLGVILSVLISAAVMGSYTPILWLLVGPPIFIFISGINIGGSSNTLKSKGPDWKFGSFEDTANFKQEVMLRNNTPVDVSYFFHKYNEIISEIYQEIINKITSEDVTSQMLFMARQRVMEDLFAIEPSDPMAIHLAVFFNTHCSNEMTLAREIATGIGERSSAQRANYATLKEQYCRLYDMPDKKIENPSLEEYLTTLKPAHVKGEPLSCAKLWVYMRQSLVKDVASQAELALSAAVPQEARITTLGWAGVARRIVDDFLKKVAQEKEKEESIEDPCPYNSGELQKEGIVEQGDSFSLVANIMSQLMYKKLQIRNSGSTPYQKILAGDSSGVINNSDGVVGGFRTNVSAANEQAKRLKSQELSVARKYESFVFLTALPYFQGALLYVLALLYPFFAMMILVPGKAQAFIGWMALWAWAKSWDIGWAIVMVTDKLLWNLMPHATFYDLNDNGGFTPVNTMEMHFSGDYAFSVSLYWMLVSVLITSVPIITAEIILGAKRGVASAFTSGASDIAARLSTAAENYTSVMNIGAVADQRSNKEMGEYTDRQMGAHQLGNNVGKNVNDIHGASEPERLSQEGLGHFKAQNPESTAKASEQQRNNASPTTLPSKKKEE